MEGLGSERPPLLSLDFCFNRCRDPTVSRLPCHASECNNLLYLKIEKRRIFQVTRGRPYSDLAVHTCYICRTLDWDVADHGMNHECCCEKAWWDSQWLPEYSVSVSPTCYLNGAPEGLQCTSWRLLATQLMAADALWDVPHAVCFSFCATVNVMYVKSIVSLHLIGYSPAASVRFSM